MGKLAFWKGVEGAAQGQQENIKNQREDRIAKLKAEQDVDKREDIQAQETQIVDTQIQGKTDISAAGDAAAAARQGSEQEFKTSERAGTEEFKADQSQLERESEERIAGARAAASGTSAANRRFQPKTITEVRTDDDGYQYNQDVLAVFDQQSARTFIQSGDKFVPQGVDVSELRRAPVAAINDLLKNPDDVDLFLREYKYLPIEAYGLLQ